MKLLNKTLGFFGLQTKSSNTIREYSLDSIRDTWQLLNVIGASGCDSSFTITPQEAYNIYQRTQPVRDAVDKIADAVAALPLVVSEKGNDDTTDDHEVLTYLNALKEDVHCSLRDMTISSLLTEEVWLVLRGGRINSAPLQILPIRPYDISIESTYDDYDGLPSIIRTDSPFDKRIYYKHEIAGQARFLDARDVSSFLNELSYSVETVEPVEQFRGLSRLTAIKQEANHVWHGNVHNTGLLKNRMRPDALITPKENITQESQFEELSKSLKKLRENPGKSGVLPSAVEAIELLIKNVDADYLNLTEKAENRIYSLYNIPLPLVNTKSMTLSNYESSQYAFYDTAVTRESAVVFKALSEVLKTRTGFDGVITFNPHSIKALQQRQAERMKELRASQTLSTPEIRATAGYSPEPEDGGDILVSATLVPENSGEAESQFGSQKQ